MNINKRDAIWVDYEIAGEEKTFKDKVVNEVEKAKFKLNHKIDKANDSFNEFARRHQKTFMTGVYIGGALVATGISKLMNH